MNLVIPEPALLIQHVLDHRPFKASYLHGEQHWKCVATTGLSLLPEVPGADPLVVFLFALLHDARRLDDGHDLQHGPRAAALAVELNGRLFHLTPAALKLLTRACEQHTDGLVTQDPTVGLCWDSDRLNLWRIGVRPAAKYLSTDAAQVEAHILAARDLHGQQQDWEVIYQGVFAHTRGRWCRQSNDATRTVSLKVSSVAAHVAPTAQQQQATIR